MNRLAAVLDSALKCQHALFDEDSYEECSVHFPARSSRIVDPRGVMDFPSAMQILQLQIEVGGLTRQCKILQDRIQQLEGSAVSMVVPITTLAPEPFDLLREFPMTVVPEDGGYLATFFDAGISMTGDTREEAVANLRMMLVDMFDDFEAQEHQLGPEPKRQLDVLRTFIRRQQLPTGDVP